MKRTLRLCALIIGILSLTGSNNVPTVINPENTAIVLVDLQNDFTEYSKGSLAVAGDQGTKADYIDKVRSALKYLKGNKFYIVATQDWHPEGHISFASTHPGKKPYEDVIYIDNTTHKVVKPGMKDAREQRLWPKHCVQNSDGAQLVEGLEEFVDVCVHKGTDKHLESYSGFYTGFFGPGDKRNIKSPLDGILKKKGIKNVIVFGLATDFCVGATAKDGAAMGYRVTFVKDLSEAVFGKESTAKVCKEMEKCGIRTSSFQALQAQIK